MALAEQIGRQTAHDVVGEAAMEALDSKYSFADCLRDDERVVRALSEEDIDALTDPTAYTSVADTITERTVAASRRERE